MVYNANILKKCLKTLTDTNSLKFENAQLNMNLMSEKIKKVKITEAF